jgi:hypothetical protein
MPTISKPAASPSSSAKKLDAPVRVRDVGRDPVSILHRAAQGHVRVSAKNAARTFHIATIRRGDRRDPAWADAMPVSITALKRRARRILHLASGLQIALRVQVTAKSPDVYFIEPGGDSLEFAALRLGGSSRDAALLKNAVRRSRITRSASAAAAKQADTRRRNEIRTLQGRIVNLERAAKKHTDLAEAFRNSETALRATKKSASERDEEIGVLKSRIATLERTLSKQKAAEARRVKANAENRRPEPESSPSGIDESEASAPSADEAA